MTLSTVEFASETVKSETLAFDAVERFHEALNELFTGNVSPMAESWSSTSDVCILPPFGGRLLGRTEVLSLFERNTKVIKGGRIAPRDLLLGLGQELAYSICIERGELLTFDNKTIPVELRSTNIVKKEGDEWRMIYHHTDPLPLLKESLKIEEFASPKGEIPDSSVAKALEEFNDASRSMFEGKFGPMSNIWAKTDDVTQACPTGNIHVGWKSVRHVMEQHSGLVRGTPTYKDPLIRVYDDLAFASYRLYVPDLTINQKPYPMDLRATTVFRRDGRKWLVVHNHTDLAHGLAEIAGLPTK